MEVSGFTLWTISRHIVSDFVAAEPLESHAAQSEHLSQACRDSLFSRTTKEQKKTPMGVTYVSGVRQKVLLQRAAHPHEPPLRPDSVGQVAHGDSAAPVTPVASVVSQHRDWLSFLHHFTYL